jgi:hypothetical protein
MKNFGERQRGRQRERQRESMRESKTMRERELHALKNLILLLSKGSSQEERRGLWVNNITRYNLKFRKLSKLILSQQNINDRCYR